MKVKEAVRVRMRAMARIYTPLGDPQWPMHDLVPNPRAFPQRSRYRNDWRRHPDIFHRDCPELYGVVWCGELWNGGAV